MLASRNSLSYTFAPRPVTVKAGAPSADPGAKPKAKAKAKLLPRTSITPSCSPASSAKQQVGRPKRPLLEVCHEIVEEFKACGQNESYFGQQPNARRSLNRYVKLFREGLEAAEDSPDYIPSNADNFGLRKQLEVCENLCKAWVKDERFGEFMSKEFISNRNFCRLQPSVVLPAPRWLVRMCLEWEAEVSFRFVSIAVLPSGGVVIAKPFATLVAC
jgi:hypothetical protein